MENDLTAFTLLCVFVYATLVWVTFRLKKDGNFESLNWFKFQNKELDAKSGRE